MRRIASALAFILGIASASATEIPKFTAKLVAATVAPMGSDILGDGSKAVTLKIAVTNHGKRDVSLIDARVIFADRLDDHIATIKWKNNRGIPAGKTVTMTEEYWNLETSGVDRLAEIDPSDLLVTFDVYGLAYKAGEVIKVKE